MEIHVAIIYRLTDRSARAIARDEEISPQTVINWARRYEPQINYIYNRIPIDELMHMSQEDVVMEVLGAVLDPSYPLPSELPE
jgi:hypothetical protein